MPGNRYFGAREGAGAAVIMRGPGARINPGDYGTTVLVNAFRSGPLDELVQLDGGADQFRAIYGRPSPLIAGAFAAEDFYRLADGAGTLHVLRIAADDARVASRPLYSREAYRSILSRAPHRPAYLAGTVQAHNVGRWGGRTARIGATSLTWATSTRANVSGMTLVENQWIGATFWQLDTTTGLVFETSISGNDDTGFDLVGPAPSSITGGGGGYWYADLDDIDRDLQARERVTVSVVDDTDDLGDLFGLRVNRDGAAALDADGLTVDPANVRWDTQIANWPGNYVIAVDREDYEGDASLPAALPADFAECVKAVSGATITFQTVRWTRTSPGSGNAYLETDLDWTEATIRPKCRLRFTCTFTTSTAYTVTMEADGMPSVSVGSGSTGSQFNSGAHPLLPRWTLRAGTSPMAAGDVIVIDWRPVPELDAGIGYLYPAATSDDGDPLTRFRISSTTTTTVTVLGTTDLSSLVDLPTAPTHTGATAGPFLLAGSDTFIYTLPGRAAITLTSTLPSGSTTTTATVAELNARELARAGSSAAKLVLFEVGTGDKVKVTALRDFGADATLVIGAGTLNSLIGLSTSDTDAGTNGSVARLEMSLPLLGGCDGSYVATADVLPAFQDGSLLDDLDDLPVGLVRVMAPGLSANTTIGTAMAQWAYEHNAQAVPSIPSTVTTEADAIAWVRANLPADDRALHLACYWPSAGYHVPTLPNMQTDTVLTYLEGAILGIAARVARDSQGYHVAPAGDAARLDRLYTRLIVDRVRPEILGKFGVNPIVPRNGEIRIMGARVPAAGRPFLHVRAARMHIARILLTGTGVLTFRAINDATLAEARTVVRSLFEVWHAAGWFDDSEGPAFDDAVTIKADRSNNPLTERELGNLHVAVDYAVVGTAERVISTVGPKGLSTQF